jgi:hypothetical protein
MKKELPNGAMAAIIAVVVLVVVGLGWMVLGKTPGAIDPAPPGTKIPAPPPPPPPGG